MADVVTTIRIRVLAVLIRRGVIEDSTEQLVLLPDGLAEDEPVRSQVSSAAASGLPPAGPERREREHLRVARSPGPKARSTWRPWPELLKRSFDIDIQCSKCGGSMRLKALLTRPQSLRRLLTALGQPTDAPQRAPPRPPVGRVREQDNGQPVDTVAEYPFMEGLLEFDGAPQLMRLLAEALQTHRCYASHLAESALAHELGPEQLPLVDALSSASLDEQASLCEMMPNPGLQHKIANAVLRSAR